MTGPASPFDGQTLEQMRATALQQAGFGNSPQADAMTALYLIAALIDRIAALSPKPDGAKPSVEEDQATRNPDGEG